MCPWCVSRYVTTGRALVSTDTRFERLGYESLFDELTEAFGHDSEFRM